MGSTVRMARLEALFRHRNLIRQKGAIGYQCKLVCIPGSHSSPSLSFHHAQTLLKRGEKGVQFWPVSRRVPLSVVHTMAAVRCTSSSNENIVGANKEPPGPADAQQTFVQKAAPGVAAAFVISELGFAGADLIGAQLLALQGLTGASPISGIPVAIILGLALKNSGLMSEATLKTLNPGLDVCKKTVLQTGIVCIGAKLSALDIVTTGLVGIPAVLLSIGTGLTLIPWLGKQLSLPPKMSALIAAGCSICGVTAISALAPIIKANQQEISFAVANVVIFGTLGMLTLPYLAHELFAVSQQAGIFLGLAVHDTAQVMGAALTYKTVFGDEVVFAIAAVTKLTRNIFLAAVIPWLAWRTHRAEGEGGAGTSGRGASSLIKTALPIFVVAFLCMATVRSAGDSMLQAGFPALLVLDAQQWKWVCSTLGNDVGSRFCLGTAMAAVGSTTSLSVLRGVGMKPFLLGAAGSVSVAFTAFVAVSLLASAGMFSVSPLYVAEGDGEQGVGTQGRG